MTSARHFLLLNAAESAGCPLAYRARTTSLARCMRYSSWSTVHSISCFRLIKAYVCIWHYHEYYCVLFFSFQPQKYHNAFGGLALPRPAGRAYRDRSLKFWTPSIAKFCLKIKKSDYVSGCAFTRRTFLPNFIPDPILYDGALGFLKRSLQQLYNKKKTNKMSSGMRSVPDLKRWEIVRKLNPYKPQTRAVILVVDLQPKPLLNHIGPPYEIILSVMDCFFV